MDRVSSSTVSASGQVCARPLCQLHRHVYTASGWMPKLGPRYADRARHYSNVNFYLSYVLLQIKFRMRLLTKALSKSLISTISNVNFKDCYNSVKHSMWLVV